MSSFSLLTHGSKLNPSIHKIKFLIPHSSGIFQVSTEPQINQSSQLMTNYFNMHYSFSGIRNEINTAETRPNINSLISTIKKLTKGPPLNIFPQLV